MSSRIPDSNDVALVAVNVVFTRRAVSDHMTPSASSQTPRHRISIGRAAAAAAAVAAVAAPRGGQPLKPVVKLIAADRSADLTARVIGRCRRRRLLRLVERMSQSDETIRYDGASLRHNRLQELIDPEVSEAFWHHQARRSIVQLIHVSYMHRYNGAINEYEWLSMDTYNATLNM